MKTIQLLTILGAPLLFSNCRETKQKLADAKTEVATAGDVTFAKSTFESLARGDSTVASKIDWPVFTSLGENMGATYVALTTGAEKEKFISAFITQFAVSFRENGGSVDAFTSWRVTAHDSTRTEVAADSSSGVLTIIVAERDGLEKVSSISILK
ncbi:MAG: hypothetical protein ABIS50_20675 [Luteolibacter sp.]|uniref:hypothetical protein n=1 Tax=Luteolibacter sp. TaxID=1962973 RepID=UPI003265D75A